MAMLPIPTTYTSYTQAQEHFLQVLEQVELGNSIVITMFSWTMTKKLSGLNPKNINIKAILMAAYIVYVKTYYPALIYHQNFLLRTTFSKFIPRKFLCMALFLTNILLT